MAWNVYLVKRYDFIHWTNIDNDLFKISHNSYSEIWILLMLFIEKKELHYFIEDRNTSAYKASISTLWNNSQASWIAVFKNLRDLHQQFKKVSKRNVSVIRGY